MQPLIQLTNLQKFYRLGRVDVRALQDVTLDIEAGELVALAGPSGSLAPGASVDVRARRSVAESRTPGWNTH